jgi:hypothetical protein
MPGSVNAPGAGGTPRPWNPPASSKPTDELRPVQKPEAPAKPAAESQRQKQIRYAKTVKVRIVAMQNSKGKVTLRFTKARNASLYQIQYRVKGSNAWKTKWVRSTASRVVLGKTMSGKRYQAKIRACTKIGGKIYFGKWSNVRTGMRALEKGRRAAAQ